MELNREKIMKALEHCISGESCDDCPLTQNVSSCEDCNINGLSLALIKYLKEKNAELTERNRQLRGVKESYETFIGALIPNEELIADTVRKMSEKLKAYFGTYFLGYKIPISEALKALNQTSKEILGEEICQR